MKTTEKIILSVGVMWTLGFFALLNSMTFLEKTILGAVTFFVVVWTFGLLTEWLDHRMRDCEKKKRQSKP